MTIPWSGFFQEMVLSRGAVAPFSATLVFLSAVWVMHVTKMLRCTSDVTFTDSVWKAQAGHLVQCDGIVRTVCTANPMDMTKRAAALL